MRALVGLGLAAATLIGAGEASAQPSVEIDHAVARVTVIPEARSDVAVSVVRPNGRFPLKISRVGDVVHVEGGLGWRSINCHSGFGGRRVSVWGVGDVAYADLPQIVVRTPRAARIGAGGAVFGAVGPGDSVDLANGGCGDWTVADQAGALRAHLSGSGDIHAGSAGSADVQVSGSADVTMGEARGGLTVSIAGSGDVTAARVQGPLRARIGGSGDLRVHDGQVTDMDVAVAGSGDVRFGGVARALQARIAGSGDVSVARVTGSVTKSVVGSGDVSVGR
jgi:hypothetical protein